MGVPGLWDVSVDAINLLAPSIPWDIRVDGQILRPAVARQSLATLSRHAFQTSPLRALTIGIDASCVLPADTLFAL